MFIQRKCAERSGRMHLKEEKRTQRFGPQGYNYFLGRDKQQQCIQRQTAGVLTQHGIYVVSDCSNVQMCYLVLILNLFDPSDGRQ